MRTISPQGSKRLFIASLLLLYLLMLALNLFTPFGMDDYYYAFSCLTGERMTRLDQLIPSLIAHGKVMNGRYAAHFFVQLFAMLPNFIFDLCNAAVFVLLVLGLYRLAGDARRYDVRLLLLVGCPVFLLLPDFGSPVLWMSGSLNYLWFGTLAVWMLIPFRNALIDQAAAPRIGKVILLSLGALLVGNTSENFSMAFAFLLGLCFLAERFVHKRWAFWMLPVLFCIVAGWVFLMAAPGERERVAGGVAGFGVYLERLVEVLQNWKRYLLAPTVVFAVLLGISPTQPETRDRRIFACLTALSAFLCNGAMTLANYYPLRIVFWPVILMIAACALLLPTLEGPKTAWALNGASLLLCFLLAVDMLQALPNDYNRYRLYEARTAEIVALREEGETDIHTFGVLSRSKYDMFVNIELGPDPESWLNQAAARYFGVEKIAADRFE